MSPSFQLMGALCFAVGLSFVPSVQGSSAGASLVTLAGHSHNGIPRSADKPVILDGVSWTVQMLQRFSWTLNLQTL